MGNGDLPPYPCIENNTSSTGSGSLRISSFINGSVTSLISPAFSTGDV